MCMSKRIEEIAKEAKDYAIEQMNRNIHGDRVNLMNTNFYSAPVFEKKFAELLLKECANLVGGYTKECEFGKSEEVKEAYEEITKHFGLTEN